VAGGCLCNCQGAERQVELFSAVTESGSTGWCNDIEDNRYVTGTCVVRRTPSHCNTVDAGGTVITSITLALLISIPVAVIEPGFISQSLRAGSKACSCCCSVMSVYFLLLLFSITVPADSMVTLNNIGTAPLLYSIPSSSRAATDIIGAESFTWGTVLPPSTDVILPGGYSACHGSWCTTAWRHNACRHSWGINTNAPYTALASASYGTSASATSTVTTGITLTVPWSVSVLQAFVFPNTLAYTVPRQLVSVVVLCWCADSCDSTIASSCIIMVVL
jgi:hypothetical protein